MAFWVARHAAERTGAEVVPGGNLPSAQRVRRVDELRELVAELAGANDAVREYGDEHGIPAIGRTAERVDGAIATLRQDVPGALSDREE